MLNLFGTILPFIGFRRNWPVDIFGHPIEGYGKEQTLLVGDVFSIEWFDRGYALFVKNIRTRKK